MRRKHNSDVTEKCNALFGLHSGYCVNMVRSRCAQFQLMLRALECIPVQSNSFPVCLFPECFSEVTYVMFLLEQTGQLLLCLWRADNETTKEATLTTCEDSLRALFWL
jgi:hypothetical protein